MREVETYFRNNARDGNVSNEEFFEEMEYIKANNDKGTIVPLELSASEAQFKFYESMDCINEYIQT